MPSSAERGVEGSSATSEVVELLRDTLDRLDSLGESLVAIHVSRALDILMAKNCVEISNDSLAE